MRRISTAARSVVQAEGWNGLYKGIRVSIVEIMPYIAISFGGYEYFKSQLLKGYPDDGTWIFATRKLMVGWISGVTASLVCYPLDTVKRRIMLDGATGDRSRFNGSVRICISTMFKESGIGAFYRG